MRAVGTACGTPRITHTPTYRLSNITIVGNANGNPTDAGGGLAELNSFRAGRRLEGADDNHLTTGHEGRSVSAVGQDGCGRKAVDANVVGHAVCGASPGVLGERRTASTYELQHTATHRHKYTSPHRHTHCECLAAQPTWCVTSVPATSGTKQHRSPYGGPPTRWHRPWRFSGHLRQPPAPWPPQHIRAPASCSDHTTAHTVNRRMPTGQTNAQQHHHYHQQQKKKPQRYERRTGA